MIEIKTGTDVIRGALFNRAKHAHLAPTARDLGVNISALEDFAHGRGSFAAGEAAGAGEICFHIRS